MINQPKPNGHSIATSAESVGVQVMIRCLCNPIASSVILLARTAMAQQLVAQYAALHMGDRCLVISSWNAITAVEKE